MAKARLLVGVLLTVAAVVLPRHACADTDSAQTLTPGEAVRCTSVYIDGQERYLFGYDIPPSEAKKRTVADGWKVAAGKYIEVDGEWKWLSNAVVTLFLEWQEVRGHDEWSFDYAHMYSGKVIETSWLRPTIYEENGLLTVALAQGDRSQARVTGVDFFVVGEERISRRTIAFTEPLDEAFFRSRGFLPVKSDKGLSGLFAKKPELKVCGCLFFLDPKDDVLTAIAAARDQAKRLHLFSTTLRSGKWSNVERQSDDGSMADFVLTGKEYAFDGRSGAFVWRQLSVAAGDSRERVMKLEWSGGQRSVSEVATATADSTARVDAMWLSPYTNTVYALAGGVLTAVDAQGKSSRYSAGNSARIVDLIVNSASVGPLAVLAADQTKVDCEEIVALWDISGNQPAYVLPVFEQRILSCFRCELLLNGNLSTIAVGRWGAGGELSLFNYETAPSSGKGPLSELLRARETERLQLDRARGWVR